MTVEQAIQDRLDAAISAATVYQLRRQQHGSLPAMRVQLIDDPRGNHLRGRHSRKRARIQVDLFSDATTGSDPYAEAADELVEEIEGALGPEPFIVGTSPDAVEVLSVAREDRRAIDDPDQAQDEVRISMDFIVWYKHV